MYNSSLDHDTTLVTGSWDVVFALPTDASPGELSSLGQAWTHPHSSNNLTDWHMMTTYSSSSWSTLGSPAAGPEEIPNSSKIFPGGYNFTTNSATDQGIYQPLSVSPGDDFVVRAIAHSDGTSQPMVIIYDEDSSTGFTNMTGTTSSNRTNPDVFIFTFEVPDGTTNISVRVVNNVSSGT
jgi:hypothetical protein